MRANSARTWALGVAALWSLSACRGDAAASGESGQSASGVHSAEVTESPPTLVRDTLLEPGELHSMSTAEVQGWTGPGGHPFAVLLRTAEPASSASRRFGTIALQTALRSRSPDLGQYPCTSCHLGRRLRLADERRPDAHRNITAAHPVQTGGACSTCHASDNVELLALKSGQRSTLDHTYRLCAQCHFAQAEAWAGGGHGKRLDGWQGRRVVMGCADCHDPHQPALVPRTPFRAPRIERIRDPLP